MTREPGPFAGAGLSGLLTALIVAWALLGPNLPANLFGILPMTRKGFALLALVLVVFGELDLFVVLIEDLGVQPEAAQLLDPEAQDIPAPHGYASCLRRSIAHSAMTTGSAASSATIPPINANGRFRIISVA